MSRNPCRAASPRDPQLGSVRPLDDEGEVPRSPLAPAAREANVDSGLRGSHGAVIVLALTTSSADAATWEATLMPEGRTGAFVAVRATADGGVNGLVLALDPNGALL